VIHSVDLFAGCGGMTLGLLEAARRHGLRLNTVLAVDSDPEVVEVYERNFSSANCMVSDVAAFFDGPIGASLTPSEQQLAAALPRVDVLQGGPPCQGHSDLNNHTRRRDPKNALYLKMARAAEVLKPDVVVIENVPPVQWDRSGVVAATKRAFEASNYAVSGKVVNLQTVGVPQRRLRYVLIASKVATVNPAFVFSALAEKWGDHRARTVEWAIRDLEEAGGKTTYDTPSARSDDNARRIAYLFQHGCHDLPNDQRPRCHRNKDHSYNSVYGRLWWNRPAQTITTGFGSMGQGRYVHPQRWRTITPHEAARLQTFPDWFDFGQGTRRGVLAKAIGNAVPPMLMLELGNLILPALAATAAADRLRA
jgi:DNA (cytosine-5)-methyltransferase 1